MHLVATNRLQVLKSMLELEPSSAFARYGLAMEYVNTGSLEEAVSQFAELRRHSPDYAAGYYHAGQTLEKLNRPEEAKEVYQAGIAVTDRTGDAHTRSELQAALEMVGL